MKPVVGMDDCPDDASQAGGHGIVFDDCGLGFFAGFYAELAQFFGDGGGLLILRDEDGAGDAVVQSTMLVEQTVGGMEVLCDPDGLVTGFLGRVVGPFGLGEAIPVRFAFLGRLSFVGMTLLCPEILGPVGCGFLSEVVWVKPV